MNRSTVFAMAAASGICIEDAPGTRRCLTAYAPAGRRFTANGEASTVLWSAPRGEPVDWHEVAAELELAPRERAACHRLRADPRRARPHCLPLERPTRASA